MVCHGNSITRGFGSTDVTINSYPVVLAGLLEAAYPGQWAVTRKGFDGFTTTQLTANFATEVHALLSTTVGRNVVVIHEGANEIKNGLTVQQAIDNMITYCTQARNLGWEVWLCTATPRVNTAQVEANIAEWNAYVRANAGPVFHAHRLIDLEADPSLSNAHNLTYYNVDGIHPTDAGYAVIANVVFNSREL